jgi:hypothetical protein
MPGSQSDDDFLEAFRTGALPLAEFDHRAHVLAGYLYVARFGLGLAIERFGKDLRGFASAHGKHGLYHETITVAFLALINERIALGGDRGWDAFAADNPDLFGRDSLRPFYAPEELASPEARRVFLLPRRRGTKQNQVESTPVKRHMSAST